MTEPMKIPDKPVEEQDITRAEMDTTDFYAPEDFVDEVGLFSEFDGNGEHQLLS